MVELKILGRSKFFVLVFAALALTPLVNADAGVSSCMPLTQSGTYKLVGNIDTQMAQPCFEIQADNIVFDGNGFELQNVLQAFQARACIKNFALQNLKVQGISSYSPGVFIGDVENGRFSNIKLRGFFSQGFEFGLGKCRSSASFESIDSLEAEIGHSTFTLDDGVFTVKNSQYRGTLECLSGAAPPDQENTRCAIENSVQSGEGGFLVGWSTVELVDTKIDSEGFTIARGSSEGNVSRKFVSLAPELQEKTFLAAGDREAQAPVGKDLEKVGNPAAIEVPQDAGKTGNEIPQASEPSQANAVGCGNVSQNPVAGITGCFTGETAANNAALILLSFTALAGVYYVAKRRAKPQ